MKDTLTIAPNYEECPPYPPGPLKTDRRGNEMHPMFVPDWTPEEVFLLGSFGGAYYTPYPKCMPTYLLAAVEYDFLMAPTPRPENNLYGVLSGNSLREWIKRKSIRRSGPLGFMSWYANYWDGVRTDEDKYWIWLWYVTAGPIGKFRTHFSLAYAEGRLPRNDITMFVASRQTLLQWGVRLDWDRDVLRRQGFHAIHTEHRPMPAASRNQKVKTLGKYRRERSQRAISRVQQIAGLSQYRLNGLLQEMADAKLFGVDTG